MSQQNEIIISCPGGKCPIKKSCLTWNKPNATLMPREPFVQVGMHVKCYYLELKPVNDERRLPEQIVANSVEPKAEGKQENKILEREAPATVQAVASDQGSLFS